MATNFTKQISKDGEYPPEAGRYHFYHSYACPFSERVMLVLKLKGLEDAISVSIVDYEMKDGYWQFGTGRDGVTVDHVNGFKLMKEVYDKADPTYAGRCTVPVLFDKKTQTIVNNESAQILRILNSQFQEFAKYPEVDLYPEHLHKELDEFNDWIMLNVGSQFYKTSSQQEYDQAVKTFFGSLDILETRLSKSRYLKGDQLTEADIKLFVILLRLDLGFNIYSKMNLKQLRDYPNLLNFVREIYQRPSIRPIIKLYHIKGAIFSRANLPEPRIIPAGPSTEYLETPHDRDRQF